MFGIAMQFHLDGVTHAIPAYWVIDFLAAAMLGTSLRRIDKPSVSACAAVVGHERLGMSTPFHHYCVA